MKRRCFAVLLLLSLCLSGCAQENPPTAFPSATLDVNIQTEPASLTAEAPPLENRTLIAYFTLGRNAGNVDASTSASLLIQNGETVGTTEAVARMIWENTGGDLHLIQTAAPYPDDFQAVVDQNHQEMNAGFLPALVESELDVSRYDTVFLGYPVWATNAPQAIFSFLAEYDLSGKTIVPFCTHDGYGSGSSFRNIENAIPGCTALDGLAVEASNVPGSEETVASWLDTLGFAPAETVAPQGERAITITVDGMVLDGILYDTALAQEISQNFPLTISMVGYGGREYYGGVSFYPSEGNLVGGGNTFQNGDITYCEAHHNMAIFYAQTNTPTLSVDVIPIGRVTSSLEIFESLSTSATITFAFAE